MGLLKYLGMKAKGEIPLTAKRSPQWSKIRNEHLKSNPTCVSCGSTKTLEVHHIKPFHIFPELELDQTNLITLCENSTNGIVCHLFIGHRGCYRDNNDDVVEDSKIIKDYLDKKRKGISS